MIWINKRNIFKVALVIWVILWINFIGRDLFKRKFFYDYVVLIKRDAEGKRAYSYGDHFYEFLKFSESILPEKIFYDFAGVEIGSIAWRRAIYYLYPRINREDPDYILVYNIREYKKDEFGLLAKLDEDRYILKRK